MNGKVYHRHHESVRDLNEVKLCMYTYSQGQGSSALCIDHEEGGDGGQDLDSTIAKGSIQGLDLRIPDILKDGRAVKGDNVDSAHLLGNHDRRRAIIGPPDSGHGEAIPHAGKVSLATSKL